MLKYPPTMANERVNPIPEKPLSPDDYASIANIVSWANTCIEGNYPDLNAPLSLSQIKVVPEEKLLDVVNAESNEAYNPFAREIFELTSLKTAGRWPGATDKSERYEGRDLKTLYLGGQHIDELRRDKIWTSLVLGLALCHGTLALSTTSVVDTSEEAQKLGFTLVKNMNGLLFLGVSQEDIAKMVRYMEGKDVGILRRGAMDTVIVEGKPFLPPVGRDEDNAISNYILRPIRSSYADLIGRELNLKPLDLVRLRNMAAEPAVNTPTHVALERQTIVRLNQVGLRNRREVARSFLSGEIGLKLRRRVG